MRTKYRVVLKNEAKRWLDVANIIAKSLISYNDAIQEYNKLSMQKRLQIKHLFSKYDDIRRKKIPKGEMDEAWEISVMVDSHIIATEHSINPLTAVMCINPPCSIRDNVLVK